MQQDIKRGTRSHQDHLVRHALRRASLTAFGLLCLVAATPTAAEPQPVLTTSLPAPREVLHAVGRAGPTAAWMAFCEQQPDECAIDASEPAELKLSRDSWSTLSEVNERVNRTILAVTDQEHWGAVDRWDYPDDGLGDCEDIQLLKRRLLVQAGLPRRALRMTVVVDEQGEGHAVLMARTDHGDFILDNKRNAVLAWQQTGYQYVKREDNESSAWVWLGNTMAPIVTANR